MKHTDFYDVIQNIKQKEQQELKAALEAHGGSYSWWNEETEYFADSEYPIIAVNLGRAFPGPTDLEVMKAYVEDNVLTIVGQDKENGEIIEIDPYDAFAGHLSYITELIPATDHVEDVAVAESQFQIPAYVSLDDLKEAGFQTELLTSKDICNVADVMGSLYSEYGYADDIRIAAEKLGLKVSKEHTYNTWFKRLDFRTMETITKISEQDFSPKDGSQDFVDACEQWWDSLTIREKEDYYERYS